ncbi:BUB protein kinase [Phytophthora cinnamomi]|uniref:BUB protein kinase n=1 Tax=Phytophthora cinnamomi TaxID=4785 RepID=UPI003559BB4A|nr:BUB protein kinase [Phytophthora cinnamomi]
MTRATPDHASFGCKRKADDFEWESSKENVMPLKRGRNVADLNKALRAHDSFQTKLRLEDEVKAKEDAIAAYNGDDPLAGWLDYVRWLEVKMPEDTRKKFKVLEKCTRELKDHARYRNDMRYIRLWIQYADLVSNPKDIFKYLYQNKIGERVSLFYIGWAYVLETTANYPQAHKIYLKASQRNAEPQDLLERKYKEFQRRMSRQWLRMTEETGVSDLDERQQLHQHHASARAQRVQQANAHKPVFIIYEDSSSHTIDPFAGNGGWKKLDTAQQQDKENQIAPSAWNPPSARAAAETGSSTERRLLPALSSRAAANPLQVFVDDEFTLPESDSKRRTPLTHRSQSLRQRMEGVATEEEMLAQEPLKNFTASDKKRMQKQGENGSPPRQPKKPSVWEVKEDDPVERKLHFSVFDDSVDSVAVNPQDQSLRQDLNESIPKQTFQICTDDVAEEPRTGKKSWSQKRKPLGARDDLVRSGRLTNKDVLMQAEKDAAAKDFAKSSCIQGVTKNVAREESPRNLVQSTGEGLFEKERQNLAWEFYITNRVKKKLRVEKKIPDGEFPLPKLSGLHLFPNGALMIMDKGNFGTLFDVLNCYKQAGVPFPEVLAVYYSIRMLKCIELLHSAHVLHGDIKPDNWLMTSFTGS